MNALPLAISFGKSSSANFAQAVRLAASLPGYQVQGAGKEILHQVTFDLALDDDPAWEKLQRLLGRIGTWRSTTLLAGGREKATWEFLHAIQKIKACLAQKARHHGGELFCSGKDTPTDEGCFFGCRLCRRVSRFLSQASSYDDQDSWLRFGSLAPDLASFRVDKEAIRQVLLEEATAAGYSYCPAFQVERLEADLDELPDVIDLRGESKFVVRYSEVNPQKALGIQLRVQEQQAWFAGHQQDREEDEPVARQVPTVRYEDIAGQDKVLGQVRNLVQLPLTHADYFTTLGVEPQTGVILYGPPGNGKTLIAKALAGACQAHFEIINGPEILSKWVGQSEANLRAVFARARQLAPSVLLIDELDSLAPRRDLMQHHHQVQIISQLLVLLDGLEARGQVVVLATTNRLEALDPAVCRPGRFDYHLEVPLPDRKGRAAILGVYLGKMKTAASLPLAGLAKGTAGYSGAELAALCREIGLQTILRGIARGLAPKDLFISRQDIAKARQAFAAKRKVTALAQV